MHCRTIAPSHRRTVPAAVWVFCLLAAAGGCASDSAPTAPTTSSQTPAPANAIRVLMVTATAGFRHDSIPAARQVMSTLAAANGFTVAATEDLATITAATLGSYQVLFFALTSGELDLKADQKTAILDFVSAGGGFIAVHSATDTLYTWPEYGRLVGAYFQDHPWTQNGVVIVEDATHPTTAGVGDRFSILEEFYTFRENPRPQVQVLLRLDAASVGASGDYPLAWVQSYGVGRVYYNALGHFSETWTDPRFQRQLTGAVRWAAKR